MAGLKFIDSGDYKVDAQAVGQRKIKNMCLGFLSFLESDEVKSLVLDQLNINMSLRTTLQTRNFLIVE